MKSERVETMIGVLGTCVDTDEERPWCPCHALRQDANHEFPECAECWTTEDSGDGPLDCTCCWRAFALGKPMPVDEMNKKAPMWWREWRKEHIELERQRVEAIAIGGNTDES